ncbi:MAG: hypothetical protein ACRDV2_03530, partial [Actinomycetes bacterium]
RSRSAGRVPVLAVLLAALLAAAALLATATPAAAADPIDCTPMGDPACRDLTPVVECAWLDPDGSRTVVWGYDNPTGLVLRIDVGAKNKLTPGAEDQGQPTLFQAGRQSNVFTTTSGPTVSWRLGNKTASLSGSTPACAVKPVPMVGDVLALGVYAVLLALAVPAAARRRNLTRRRIPLRGAG